MNLKCYEENGKYYIEWDGMKEEFYSEKERNQFLIDLLKDYYI